MKTNDSEERGLFTTGTKISDSNAWFLSLVRQVREFLNERRNPTPHAEITAQSDPSALAKLVDPPSQMMSLFSSIKAIMHERRHPRVIEMTATPVEVEDLWSKKENHVAGWLSVLVHVSVATALLAAAAFSLGQPKAGLEKTTVLMEPIAVSLPPTAIKPSGGGGGGNRAPTPASKGVLPKFAEIQYVPPTPFITTLPPEIAMEPTLIGIPTKLPTDLLHMGDPNGVLGPPSAGPGTGGGIGNGDGHGVGGGTGAGAGNGNGGGQGGGTYRAGQGGVSNPSCPTPSTTPDYTDEARKARIQGTVLLDVIVKSDGNISVSKIAQKIGYGLDDSAIRFVEKVMKCTPGKLQGQPVAISTKIEVNFRLF